jgi:hypothetical protein
VEHRGAVVYLSSARVIPNRGFYVPIDASRDSGSGAYHVAFLDPRGLFTIREITLQTNERTRGAVAIAFQPVEFYTHRALWYRRLFRRPKYFVLEYTAMVGSKRYSIAMVY